MSLGLESTAYIKILFLSLVPECYWKIEGSERGRNTVQKACDLSAHPSPNLQQKDCSGIWKAQAKLFLFHQSLLFILPKEEECEK